MDNRQATTLLKASQLPTVTPLLTGPWCTKPWGLSASKTGKLSVELPGEDHLDPTVLVLQVLTALTRPGSALLPRSAPQFAPALTGSHGCCMPWNTTKRVKAQPRSQALLFTLNSARVPPWACSAVPQPWLPSVPTNSPGAASPAGIPRSFPSGTGLRCASCSYTSHCRRGGIWILQTSVLPSTI